MSYFLDYMSSHRGGAAVAIVLAFSLIGMIQWFAWIFRFGRFDRGSSPHQPTNPLRYVAANFFVEIINDFRHLLALVIVILFAFTLALGMYPGLRAGDVQKIATGVQAVAAALGGLIGSIIGYYFGESAATQRASDRRSRDSAPVQAASTQAAPQPGQSDIVEAPAPPSEQTTGSGSKDAQ